jgi:trehalose 6-phosphate synthase
VDAELEAKIDREKFEITRFGKATSVRPFPISLDFESHSALAESSKTSVEMSRWRKQLGLRHERVGIGIDRIDYTKGICERFGAIDRFLTKNPEYREELVFVQVGVPSRSQIEKYHALEEEIENLAEEINAKWASCGWRPIILIKEMVPHSRLVALHRLADFCLVTSLHDGMNLVSKEYVASRVDGDGVLILSEFAGASRELTDAILVNPFDEGEMSDAIRQAIQMPEEERRRRMQRMRAAVEENNIYRWAGKIISALLKFEFPANTQADVSTFVAGRAH